jgi:hypothetical protein
MEHRMRIADLLTVPVLAALIVLPKGASAQGSITVAFGTRLGPEIEVSAYSSEHLGQWRSNYQRWTPVTLYDINGHYYRSQVHGARPVLVYTYNNEYFMPPHDQSWNGADQRYNYHRRPTEADYGRARPYTSRGAVVDRHLGHEVGVLAYSSDRAGDWRKNYRGWTPVTLYEVNGRYYPYNGAGARPVAMYRYRDEYFLPPTDRAWVDSDKRFNYKHQPSEEDHGRVRARP